MRVCCVSAQDSSGAAATATSVQEAADTVLSRGPQPWLRLAGLLPLGPGGGQGRKRQRQVSRRQASAWLQKPATPLAAHHDVSLLNGQLPKAACLHSTCGSGVQPRLEPCPHSAAQRPCRLASLGSWHVLVGYGGTGLHDGRATPGLLTRVLRRPSTASVRAVTPVSKAYFNVCRDREGPLYCDFNMLWQILLSASAGYGQGTCAWKATLGL